MAASAILAISRGEIDTESETACSNESSMSPHSLPPCLGGGATYPTDIASTTAGSSPVERPDLDLETGERAVRLQADEDWSELRLQDLHTPSLNR